MLVDRDMKGVVVDVEVALVALAMTVTAAQASGQ